ncbi:tetratricopeptide repeat protein [Aureispira sp. CCB-QB1]|uniref:tetratricopeptide repeat protein n=1 Tax=Aureispira sp. CCB-QB1 TaxID=1313421 RepID=UPI000696E1A5|nr:hypothetical protein [Aureispira sp. CCB-QB1]
MRLIVLLIFFPIIVNSQKITDYERLTGMANNLANYYHYQAAIDSLDKAINIDSMQPTAYYQRAIIRYKTGKYSIALLDFLKVIKLDTSFHFSNTYIGDCNKKLGNYLAALKFYNKALSLAPYSNSKIIVLARIEETKRLLNNLNPSKKDNSTIQSNRTTIQNKLIIVPFMGKKIEIGEEDIICSSTPQQKAETLESLINNKANIQKKEIPLFNIIFEMSHDPIENGRFVFSVETKTAKILTLIIFNQKDNTIVRLCNFQITEGYNYKVMNVNDLENGIYTFKLLDDDNQELNRELNIRHL